MIGLNVGRCAVSHPPQSGGDAPPPCSKNGAGDQDCDVRPNGLRKNRREARKDTEECWAGAGLYGVEEGFTAAVETSLHFMFVRERGTLGPAPEVLPAEYESLMDDIEQITKWYIGAVAL